MVVFILGALWLDHRWHSRLVIDRHMEPRTSLISDFTTQQTLDASSYRKLFLYFVEGFNNRVSPKGALAFYPGLPSRHGARADALEGFSRSAPLWGAWVHSGRGTTLENANGTEIDLASAFRKGLIAGTDPTSPEYWGTITDLDQRIVEASDIALSLWLFRDYVWKSLTSEQQKQVIGWLEQAEAHRVSDNNWHLFPVFIDAVVRSLTKRTSTSDSVAEHYRRFKEFYRGQGWFSDGPDDIFDFYNAWAIHYQLFWLDQVAPNWDHEFILRTRDEFTSKYKYLIGPAGIPIEGRSICYRMAAPVPLIIEQMTNPGVVSAAEAKRALDATWTYYIRKGSLRAGNITQGYCGPDPRVIDNYSGPASCLWGLRSLIVAFYNAPKTELWEAVPSLLEVEKSSFQMYMPTVGWRITGNKSTGAISIHRKGLDPSKAHLANYGVLRRVIGALLWRPFRPTNHTAKYNLNQYNSQHTFCGCP